MIKSISDHILHMINSASNELKTRSEMTKLGIYQQYLINATRQQISLYRCQQPTSRPTNQPQTLKVVISFILTPYLFLFSPFFFSFLLGLTFFCLSFLSPPLSLFASSSFFLEKKQTSEENQSAKFAALCCAALCCAALYCAKGVRASRRAFLWTCRMLNMHRSERATYRFPKPRIGNTSPA